MTTKTLLALLCLPALAHADTTRSHGSMCAPKYTSKDLVGVDERGMYNGASSGVATLTCMAPDRPDHDFIYVDQNHAYRSVKTLTEYLDVWGRDLSTTVPFSCYPFFTEDDGFSSWGPTKYMCSQAGGCPDSTTEYTGTNRISWFANDALGYGVETADHVGVVCNLPPTTSAGSSYVKSVKLGTSTQTYVSSGGGDFAYGRYEIRY